MIWCLYEGRIFWKTSELRSCRSKQPHLLERQFIIYLRMHQVYYILEFVMTSRLALSSKWMILHHILAILIFESFCNDRSAICLINVAPFTLHALYWVLRMDVSEMTDRMLLIGYNGTFTLVTLIAACGKKDKMTEGKRRLVCFSVAIVLANIGWGVEAWGLPSV